MAAARRNQLNRQEIFLISALGAGLAACGGGGGSQGTPSQPQALTVSYGSDSVLYLAQVPIAPNRPTVTGDADTWSIAPALPPGLVFASADGSISGTPSATFNATDYIVSVTNDGGEAVEATLRLGVVEPPRMAFVANSGDDTLSTYLVDAETGALRPRAFLTAPSGAEHPEDVVVHPNGFVFVPNLGDGLSPSVIATYALDSATGELTAGPSIATGIGPHAMELGPNGLFAYVTAFGSDAVYVYSVNPSTGELAQVGAPVPTQNGPSAISVDPEGRFAFVTNSLSGSLSNFRIDPVTGELVNNAPATVVAGTPVDVVVDPDGENFYLIFEDTESVIPFAFDSISGSAQALDPLPTGELPSSVTLHPTGRFAYVTNATEDTISYYAVDADNGELSTLGTIQAGDAPAGLRFDASGLYAYTVNRDSNDVSVFTFDTSSGDLNLVGGFRTRSGPTAIALMFGPAPIEERVRFAYVVNAESGDLNAFAFDTSNGELTEVGPTTSAGTTPCDAISERKGRFLWVADSAEANIRTFEIASDGSLTQLGSAVGVSGTPCGLALEPEGRFLFASSAGTDLITSFAIDQLDGSLTQLATASAGSNPQHVTIDPTGQFVYASNEDSQDITSYRIREGLFVSGPVSSVAPGNPQEVRFLPRGDRAYAAMSDSNILVPYDVDPQTGALTPIPPGRATGARPEAVELHPDGRFAYAAVSDIGAGNGHVSFFSVNDATGGLQGNLQVFTGLNPVDLRVDPSGRFLYVLNGSGDDLTILDLDAQTGVPTVRSSQSTGLQPADLVWTTFLQ